MFVSLWLDCVLVGCFRVVVLVWLIVCWFDRLLWFAAWVLWWWLVGCVAVWQVSFVGFGVTGLG